MCTTLRPRPRVPQSKITTTYKFLVNYGQILGKPYTYTFYNDHTLLGQKYDDTKRTDDARFQIYVLV